MKRLLFLLLVLAAPVFAADTKISALPDGSPAVATDVVPIARAGSNYYIPFSAIWTLPTGSQFLGTTTCTTPAFSFGGDTNAGICLTLADSAVFQSGVYTGANTGHVTVSNTNSTLSFRNAANELTEWIIGSNSIGGTVKDANRFTLTDTGATFTVPVVLGSTDTLGWSTDLFLRRDAANTLALRNSTAAQTFNIYNTFTDASNYEVGYVSFVSNSLRLGTSAAGSGTARQIRIHPGTTSSFIFNTGQVYPSPTDANALGDASGTWSNFYLSRSIQGSKSKALTETVATTFATVAVPQTAGANFAGGSVIYSVYETDGTDSTSLSGRAQFSAVNKAGTESCAPIVDVQTDAIPTAADTLSCVMTCVTGLADVVGLAMNCTDATTMTQSTLNILYRFDMPQPNTIAPQ